MQGRTSYCWWQMWWGCQDCRSGSSGNVTSTGSYTDSRRHN